MKKIAPSILSADFTRLGQQIQEVADAGADWIHVDVMDGNFVPNITFGPLIAEAVRQATSLPMDVHLMVASPDNYIPSIAEAGADYISVQAEACPHLHRTIQLIKELGVKAGVALNPATPPAAIEYMLEYLDFVLIMSVNPGFGGQEFIPNSIAKIRELKARIAQSRLRTLIQVDGGVNSKTISAVSQAGADVFVAGSAIFGSDDYAQTIDRLKILAGG